MNSGDQLLTHGTLEGSQHLGDIQTIASPQEKEDRNLKSFSLGINPVRLPMMYYCIPSFTQLEERNLKLAGLNVVQDLSCRQTAAGAGNISCCTPGQL